MAQPPPARSAVVDVAQRAFGIPEPYEEVAVPPADYHYRGTRSGKEVADMYGELHADVPESFAPPKEWRLKEAYRGGK